MKRYTQCFSSKGVIRLHCKVYTIMVWVWCSRANTWITYHIIHADTHVLFLHFKNWLDQNKLVHSIIGSFSCFQLLCLISFLSRATSLCAAPVLELRVELEDVETAPPSVEVTLNTCCHCMASHVCGGKFHSVTNLTFTHVISQMHLIRDNSVGWRLVCRVNNSAGK